MRNGLAWIAIAFSVVSLVWAIRSSVVASRTTRRARGALRAILADESVSIEQKQLALRIDSWTRWSAVFWPPSMSADRDERLWERAHAEGLVTDEVLAAFRERATPSP